MKKLITGFIAIIFIPLFLLVHTYIGVNAGKSAISSSLNSFPYAVLQNASDPFVLPNQSGGNPLQTELQRIKHPVIEWKVPVETVISLNFSSITPGEFFRVKCFKIEPIFMAVRFLRI
jgi:hypothetical protein